MLPSLAITGWAAWRVRSTYARWSKVDSGIDLSAFDFARRLLDRQGLDAVAIHSDRTQPERTRALEGFKNGEIRVLVATDVAARGLDLDDIKARLETLPWIKSAAVERRIVGRDAAQGRVRILRAIEARRAEGRDRGGAQPVRLEDCRAGDPACTIP